MQILFKWNVALIEMFTTDTSINTEGETFLFGQNLERNFVTFRAIMQSIQSNHDI